jgi:DNA polymerase
VKTCNIDIETYSAADLIKVGVFRYVEDPSTEILCISWKVKGKLRRWTSWGGGPIDHLAKQMANPKVRLEAYNAQFERVVLNSPAGVALGLPRTSISRWKDSAVQSALHALPRDLGRCASALDTHPKDDAGKKVMLALSKPRSAGKMKGRPWLYRDRPDDFHTLSEYCDDDVLAEEGIGQALPALPIAEQRNWELDQKINEHGVKVDTDLARWITETWAVRKESLAKECVKITGYKPSQVAMIRDWLADHGCDLPDLRAETVRDTLEAGVPKKVRKVLELRKEFSLTSVTKFQTLLRAVNQDNRLRGMFLYHGAQTGRWTGRIVQLHNLPRNTAKNPQELIDGLYSGELELTGDIAQQLIRPVFTGDPGLLIGDYASIELRFALWLVDDTKTLRKIRKGVDLYKDLAARIYNKPIDQITPEERFVGKQAVLGLGYGMGPDRFYAYCAAQGQPIPMALAEQTVTIYRQVYKVIYDAWWEIESTALKAVRRPGKKFTCCNGKVAYVVRGKFLYCVLPSGRPIAYPYPRISERMAPWGKMVPALCYMGMDQRTHQWCEQDTFGGRLFENICQGGSSCLLRHSMFLLDENDFTINMHVHDEIVAEEENDDRLAEFTEIMEVTPAWASGCPVKVEADFSLRYRK